MGDSSVLWITFVSVIGDGESLPLRLVGDIIIMLGKRAFAKRQNEAVNKTQVRAQLSDEDRATTPPAKKPRRPGGTGGTGANQKVIPRNWQPAAFIGDVSPMFLNNPLPMVKTRQIATSSPSRK